jgi:glutathione S-transferase
VEETAVDAVEENAVEENAVEENAVDAADAVPPWPTVDVVPPVPVAAPDPPCPPVVATVVTTAPCSSVHAICTEPAHAAPTATNATTPARRSTPVRIDLHVALHASTIQRSKPGPLGAASWLCHDRVMIKLYGGGPTRWVKPYWTLKELDVPFEQVKVSITKGETRTPEYKALHPFSKVPAMEDGDFKLFESTAICNYLADKHPDKGLIPKAGTRERAHYDQWMSFVLSELEQPLWRITRHTFGLPEPKRSAADITLAREDFAFLCKRLEPLLGEYVVGERFSVADIAMTYTLKWAVLPIFGGEKSLDEFPRLRAYMDRQMARPAFPRELYPQ